MSKEKTQANINFLKSLLDGLSKFDGQPVNDITVRKELKSFLANLKGSGISRVDKDNVVTLRIDNTVEQLAEVVTICEMDGKIYVENDRLWKTLFGLEEAIQEMEAYEYKWSH